MLGKVKGKLGVLCHQSPALAVGLYTSSKIPYSAKFSRDKIFVEINFADEGFLLAMPI